MQIYAKSILTAAMALTCSLSLVACGGGGGGGGEAAPGNGSASDSTDDSTDDGSDDNVKEEEKEPVTDYAPEDMNKVKLSGNGGVFAFRTDWCTWYDPKYERIYSGNYRYTKQGVNQGRLILTKLRADSPYYPASYAFELDVTFQSANQVYLDGKAHIVTPYADNGVEASKNFSGTYSRSRF